MSSLIALLAFVAIILLFAGLRQYTAPRLGEQLVQHWTEETRSRQQTSFDRYLRPTIKKLPKRLGLFMNFIESEEIERKLAYAGYPLRLDAEQFLGLRILVALALLIFAFYYILLGLCGGPILLIGLPITGFFLPIWWLNQQVKARQHKITLALPNMLDLLSVCVQAGMGFDVALWNITDNMTGPLGEEIDRFLREVRMGEPREEAFRRLVERNTSEELRAFANALIQAEELGTPISTTLRIQADDMRVRRGRRAKEMAAKSSPRISLVAIFLMAPSSLFLVVAALIMSVIFGGAFGTGGAGSPTPP